MEAYDASEQLP